MSKKILMLYGHPKEDSLCCALAEAYADEAEMHGHEVNWLNLFELDFDSTPNSLENPEDLEPDIRQAQALLQDSDHLVLVYPIWWGGMPARVKGFLDRVFASGVAFRYTEKGRLLPLLKGKTADILNTCDTPKIAQWYFLAGDRLQMKRAVMGFCGVKVRHHRRFGAVIGSDAAQRSRWIKQAGQLAKSL